MKTNHPYPDHVVTAVADALSELYDNATTWEQLDAADDSRADVALTALWEASRVDTWEQLEGLGEGAQILDNGKTTWIKLSNNWEWLGETVGAAGDITDSFLPAHVIHWGDHDE